MTDKAVRAPVSLGDMDVEGFQMPDGSYRMSKNLCCRFLTVH